MKDTVFQQLLKPLSKNLIQECVKRFNTDYHYSSFRTEDHLKCMIFAQIHNIESLRTLEVALNSQPRSLITSVCRSTLSDANAKRSAAPFFWILKQLMRLLPERKCSEINAVVKILDSSPIKLKGNGYDCWAAQHKTAHWQGLKLHTEYDVALHAPTKVAVSHANLNDSTMGKDWPIKPDTIYVFDKGYCDYNWWWDIHQKKAFFITRLKKNAAIEKRRQQQPVSGGHILEDRMFFLKNKAPRGGKINRYSEELRYISVKRDDKKPLILVTNAQHLSAVAIAALYKARWEIELFFKWMKGHLKINKFLGRSANAVKIQLATALITFILAYLLNKESDSKKTMYLFLTWIRFNSHKKIRLSDNKKPPPYCFPRLGLEPNANERAVYL